MRPRDIEQVVAALRPLRQWGHAEPNSLFTPDWTNQEQAEADLREYIAAALKEIANPRPGAGQIKKRVIKLVADLGRAQSAAKDLPDDALRNIGLDQKLLSDWRQASKRWADKIPVKATSGSTVDGERMLLAAAKARHLMITWTEKPVSLTDGSDYITIAALLYKIATGKTANLKKPCARHVREIRGSLSATGEPKPPSWT
jgi:hypothetical protein